MRKAIIFILIFALMLSTMSVAASAATCVHSYGMTVYYDAAHPHANYLKCTKCGARYNTGSYTTRPHTSCSSCGSHSYSGRTCTHIGTCACGATIAALGHSYGATVYYDAAHPHANYLLCTRCSARYNVGSNTTLSHTSCASCGTHSYAGATCTSGGTCSCGATSSPLGHSYGATVFYDAAHPHANYIRCTRCSARYNVGSNTTLSHSSCVSCGTHSYTGATCTSGGTCSCGATSSPLGHSYGATVYYDAAHPHANYLLCTRCSARYNVGNNTTLSHTSCASCGTHAFVGVTCTTGGTCSCGTTCAPNPAAHSYGTTVFYDAAHPHAEYLKCTRCSARYNLGSYKTLSHSSCASCGTHSYGATVYYDTAHPHAEYLTCTGCGARQNVGTYATAPHGNGTNGTCTTCGTHTYVGTTCTSYGTCACGASCSPSAHPYGATVFYDTAHPHAEYLLCTSCSARYNLSTYATRSHSSCASCGTHSYSATTYYDAAHPHAEYLTCTGCGARHDVGTYAIAPHGNGTNGTCTTCGTHTYVGQSCTSGGTCACGATGTPSAHPYGATVFYDTAHPHAEYLTCTTCSARYDLPTYATRPHSSCASCGTHSYDAIVYYDTSHPHAEYLTCTGCGARHDVGTYAAAPHGNGTNGTCPDCGSHSYGATVYYEAAHPHAEYIKCTDCSERYDVGTLATAPHGDGTNGTCTDCGEHTYVDTTCTSGGTCACGAIGESSEHSYGAVIYYDVTHPHAEYITCTGCDDRQDTGTFATLPHGDGTNGTCVECGSNYVVGIQYLTSPIYSGQNLTAQVTVDDGQDDTNRSYYVEVLGSWDNTAWYSKGGSDISLTVGQASNSVELSICIFMSGDVHTKVAVYDHQGGSLLSEKIKPQTDLVLEGDIEDYDWYAFSETDDSGVTYKGYMSTNDTDSEMTEGYLSSNVSALNTDEGGISNTEVNTVTTGGVVYIYAKRSDETFWRQYAILNGICSPTGKTSATNPYGRDVDSDIIKSSTSAGTGKYGNPFIVQPGTPRSVYMSLLSASRTYWFKCTIDGPAEFDISSTNNANINIYSRNGLHDTLLPGSVQNVRNFTKTINDNGRHTYIVSVRCSTETTISCLVKQHTSPSGNLPFELVGQDVLFPGFTWKWISEGDISDYEADVGAHVGLITSLGPVDPLALPSIYNGYLKDHASSYLKGNDSCNLSVEQLALITLYNPDGVKLYLTWKDDESLTNGIYKILTQKDIKYLSWWDNSLVEVNSWDAWDYTEADLYLTYLHKPFPFTGLIMLGSIAYLPVNIGEMALAASSIAYFGLTGAIRLCSLDLLESSLVGIESATYVNVALNMQILEIGASEIALAITAAAANIIKNEILIELKLSNSGFCFVGDTLVNAQSGFKEIKDVRIGDKVFSQNPETGEKGYKTVENVFINETNILTHIFAGDVEISSTPTHRFWVVDKGWTYAKDIEIGDRLQYNNGNSVVVSNVQAEQLMESIDVYNLEVADWHTYFVSKDSVWVHNEGCYLGEIEEAAEGLVKANTLASEYGGTNIVGSNYSNIKPTQEYVNINKVEEYVLKLENNEILPSIEVYEVPGKSGWFIEDGHHRYLASLITGKPVNIIYKTTSGPVGMENWLNVYYKNFITEGDW